MKKKIFVSFAAASAFAATITVQAEQIRYENKPVVTAPPPVYQNTAAQPTNQPVTAGTNVTFSVTATGTAPQPAPGTREIHVYDQKPLQDQPVLINSQQAQEIVELFRTNYTGNLKSPRLLIYVNRELVDESSGMKLSGHSETITTTKGIPASTNAPGNATSATRTSTVKNNYHNSTKAAPTLADRQTVRDVERLFGRPLRAAGATLVDHSVATHVIGNKPLTNFTSPTGTGVANKERAALNKIADVAIEVLISSRKVNVTEVSGTTQATVPDIQATAIRLKDSKILGQATAADVLNRAGNIGYASRNFDVQQITEATALALMEDIANSAR
jgi:hypothetical protein